MKKVCVGITGLDVSDNSMSGLGIAKCLKLSKDIKVIGISYNPFSSGCYSRDVFDEVHLINNPLQKEHKIFEDIIRLKEKYGLQVVIPSTHWEVFIYSELKNRLKRRKINILIPKIDNIGSILDPEDTFFASGTQIRMPPYTFIHDRRELAGKVSSLRFPLILKSVTENYTVLDINEAEVFVRSHFHYGNNPLCIQEYVNGEEYSVAALADENSKLSGIVIVKKLVLADQGTPWIVVSVYDKELVTSIEKLLRHFKWIGPIELRFIRDATSGLYNLIKLHTCFPSWIYLAAKVGQNLPLKALKLAMGKTTKASIIYNTGYMYVRNAEDIISDTHTLFSLASSKSLIYHD